MPHRLYQAVATRARHRCEYCRAPEEVFNQEFEVDHVVPHARGGLDEFANLALACRSCNLRKGTAQRARDPETGQIVPLFNPRTDDWGEHFAVDLDIFSIEGLTAEGRASVRRLGLNRKVQVDARRLWISRLLIGF
jgi:hypothetical protein